MSKHNQDDFGPDGYQIRHLAAYGYGRQFVFQGQNNGPETHPYSFDAYYVQGSATTARLAHNAVYCDRFSMWFDSAKLAAAKLKHLGHTRDAYENYPLAALSKFWNDLHDAGDRYRVVATGRCCNVSNGYPISILWIEDTQTS